MKRDLTRRELFKLGGGAMAGAWLLGTTPALAESHVAASNRIREQAQGFPVRGPVLWVSDEMLQTAEERIAQQQEPFYRAWLNTQTNANNVLKANYVPYQGPEYKRYFNTGYKQGVRTREVALAYRITRDERYLNKARKILTDWAVAQQENSFPESYPASELPHAAGLVIGRVTALFADTYALIYDELSEEDRDIITAWFWDMVAPIKQSQRIWAEEQYRNFDPPYLDQQFFNNHLSAQNLGLMAIGFALNDKKLIRYSIKSPKNPRDLQDMIDGAILMSGDQGWYKDPTYTEGAPAPLPGEIYDRYRVDENRGQAYSTFHLRVLTVMAEMTHNNAGRNYYEYVGPNGENLEVSFERLAPWFITEDAASVNPSYYAAENASPGFDRIADEAVMYEFAHRHYPENEAIEKVLRTRDRVLYEDEMFGWSAVLTHGLDLD